MKILGFVPMDIGGKGDTSGVDTAFFDSGIGQIIQQICNVMAILCVVIGIYQTGKAVVAGRGGTAVKSVIGTIILAAFLLNLNLLLTLIEWAITIVNGLFTSFGDAF